MKFPLKKTLMAVSAILAMGLAVPAASANDWDEQPTVKKSVAPENPNKLTGMVTATLQIDETGQVKGAEIAKSTDPSLEAPVLSAVKEWLFVPAKKDGQAVACKIKVPFQFKG